MWPPLDPYACPVPHSFVSGLPKAELHIHIEGTLEPELIFALAARNGVTLPYADVERAARGVRVHRPAAFLDIYYAGAGVLLTAEDFRDMALAYFAPRRGRQRASTPSCSSTRRRTPRAACRSPTVIDGLSARRGRARGERRARRRG